MRDGDKQSEVTKLKREIIKLLYSNPEIIEILDNEQVDPDCPDTAEWVCIFPYVKLANIQEEVGTFIGVTIDSNGPLENSDGLLPDYQYAGKRTERYAHRYSRRRYFRNAQLEPQPRHVPFETRK